MFAKLMFVSYCLSPADRPSADVFQLPPTWSTTPGALVLLLVVVEGLDQPAQHLCRGFEHRFELRLVYLLNILAEVVFDLLQPLLHLLSMMPRVALVSGSGHEWLLILWFARAPWYSNESSRRLSAVQSNSGWW